MPPKAVCEPVATTRPRPPPDRTMVPMNAHPGRSSDELAGPGGVRSFDRRLGFARQDGFVALEAVCSKQPEIGGNDVADSEMHDVARHQARHVDAVERSVAIDGCVVADLS